MLLDIHLFLLLPSEFPILATMAARTPDSGGSLPSEGGTRYSGDLFKAFVAFIDQPASFVDAHILKDPELGRRSTLLPLHDNFYTAHEQAKGDIEQEENAFIVGVGEAIINADEIIDSVVQPPKEGQERFFSQLPEAAFRFLVATLFYIGYQLKTIHNVDEKRDMIYGLLQDQINITGLHGRGNLHFALGLMHQGAGHYQLVHSIPSLHPSLSVYRDFVNDLLFELDEM